MKEQELLRYNRHILLPEIGIEGQEKLKKSSVFVIGAGGLGCPALLYMAGAGIGKIGIADFDLVDESNLQRQVLFTTTDLGFYKAERAKERLNALNPFVEIDAYQVKVDRENILQLIKDYDVVLDGSDNFSTRYLVNDACVLLNKPLVYGSIFKMEGQVSVFNYKGGPTYRCLYPQPPKPGEVLNCAEVGVVGVLPGIIGTLQANEVIKICLGLGEVLSGRLLMFDALALVFNTISFRLIPENKNIKELIDYDRFCGVSVVGKIAVEELRNKIKKGDVFQLIDVRSEEEFSNFNIGGLLIPIVEFESRRAEIENRGEIVLVCASGKRSETAASILKRHGYENVYSLEGGVEELRIKN